MTCLHFWALTRNCILYADDTTVVFVADDMLLIENAIKSCIVKIRQWCSFNKLALNVDKSKVVVFSNRSFVSPSIVLGNQPIELVDVFKYLGVQFDSKLKFNTHIIELGNKLSIYCGLAFRLKNKLNLQTAFSYYYAYFYSTVSYCITVWGGVLVCSQRGDKLVRLQNRIVRNLFSKFLPGLSTNELFSTLKLLKLHDNYKLRLATLMYKMLYCDCFPELLLFVNPTLPSHNYGTRRTNVFSLPFPKTQCVRESFSFQVIKIWNELNEVIKTKTTLRAFKLACNNFFVLSY